jgi:predicted membrane protein
MRFQKDSVRILEPYAVFFIIAGLGIGVFIPVITTFWKVSDEAKGIMLKLIWLVAALSASAYSLMVLRYLIRQGVLDCLL